MVNIIISCLENEKKEIIANLVDAPYCIFIKHDKQIPCEDCYKCIEDNVNWNITDNLRGD